MKFDAAAVSCLEMPVREVRNAEQTQEIRLPDGMPDIGKILAAWGQVILRGKEWRGDSVSFTGGMMIWVLYAPEDGGQERCIDSWVPFQMRWDLPENTAEGQLRLRCLTRFVDARNVSPRKIMVRAGMAVMAEACVPKSVEIFTAQKAPEGVELLHSTYPARLYKEAGEKAFSLEEELYVPDSIPKPMELVYYRLDPAVTERKILADKIVFRGNGNLHVLYRSEEGQLHSWDFDVPFSQFEQLRGTYGTEALGDVALAPTNLELELGNEGCLRFKGGMTAQYLISDKEILDLVEDSYSPDRELSVKTEVLELPLVLENRRETVCAEQRIPAEANIAADVCFLTDFPRQRRTEDAVQLEMTGMFQLLCYGENGALRPAAGRWEEAQKIPADGESAITAVAGAAAPSAAAGNGQIYARAEFPVEITAATVQKIPMVTGLEVGQRRIPDPGRPSLILRRAGEERLWDLAKNNGSTTEAIRRVNALEGEPEPGRMLLIPVCG